MTVFIARRISFSVITIVLVSLLIFATTEVLPGDVATAVLGKYATPASLAAMREQLDLNQPATTRYIHWTGGVVLHGDLGTSLATGQRISSIVAVRLRNTLLVAGFAALIGIPLALGLGIVAGLTRERWPDFLISAGSLVGMTVPEFVLGVLLVLLFATTWRLFPAVTMAPPNAPMSQLLPNVWLPAVTLATGMAAYIIRMTRTNLIDVMRSDFIQLATLKGISRHRVIVRHALPSALLPTINIVALNVGSLVAGAVVTESVFNYPGIGRLTVEAVQNRDLPLVQALGLLGGATFVAVNLGADLLMLALNPRIRRHAS